MHFAYRNAMLALTLTLAAAGACRADIYGYVDENGTPHFSNLRLNDRYRLLKRDPASRPQVSYAPATQAPEPEATVERAAPTGRPYAGLIRRVAHEEQVDPALLHAVVAVESGYNPRALSPKGAAGLMQLMPDTARRYAVSDVWDPTQNLRAGARYLRDLLGTFNDNLTLALAAYNAGEQAVIRAGLRVPPYAETRSYVPRVLDYYSRYRSGY